MTWILCPTQEKISQLELDLEEERGSGDLLIERLERGKEQVSPAQSHAAPCWSGWELTESPTRVLVTPQP